MFVVSFYRFFVVGDPTSLAKSIEEVCEKEGVSGTVLVAAEGVNAALAHRNQGQLGRLVDHLLSIADLTDICPIWTEAENQSTVFDKLKVQVTEEIVTFGHAYDFEKPPLPKLNPEQWVSFITDPNTISLDVRNRYETRLGRFKGSFDPKTDTFKEFSNYLMVQNHFQKDQPIGIYCTGGIRCEKAAQTMQALGYENVYQLGRGILGYFESGSPDSLWDGECFVFDKRVSLTSELKTGSAELCLACRYPLTVEDRQSINFEYGISCHHCFDELTEERRVNLAERKRQWNGSQLQRDPR